MSSKYSAEVSGIARELDMVVFKLERPPAHDRYDPDVERNRLRRELEQLRDRLSDLARAMEM